MNFMNTNTMYDKSDLGTAKDNMNSPIHNWYRFTAGFSYKFIDYIIDNTSDEIGTIYEPFAGCGTTLVAAQKRKIKSIGNESQQLMCDIINAKLNWDIDYNLCLDYLDEIHKEILLRGGKGITKSEWHDLLISLYDEQTLDVLYIIRDFVRTISDEKYRLFFELALSQTLHKVALHPIAVPYIVRSKSLAHSGHAWERFCAIVHQMLDDLHTLPHHERLAVVNHADSRLENDNIDEDSCNLCITSPPYLNNLDYGEVSKVHTHFFEITQNWHDITEKVRKHLVTGATTHYRDCDFDLNEFHQTEFALQNQKIMAELDSRFCSLEKICKERSGKKSFHILMMRYFEDMYHVLKEMRRVLCAGSKAYLILGDSAPYGIYIPTTQFLGEVAKSVGFNDYEICKIRSRGHKWKVKTRHNVELSENILILS